MPRHAIREAFDEAEPFEADPYGELRELMGPYHRHLPADQLDEILSESLGEISAEDLEGFWQDVGRFARRAAPVLQQALPIVTTVAGTAIGGPVGAALGGAAGQALSGALGAATSGPARGRGNRVLSGFAQGGLQGLGQAAGRLIPGAGGVLGGMLGGSPGAGAPGVSGAIGTIGAMGSPGALGGRGAPPASAQLLRLLSRPELPRALMQMTLGPAGAPTVPVGGSAVPLGAFSNLLAVLAGQAGRQNHAIAASAEPPAPARVGQPGTPPQAPADLPAYLLDPTGEPLGDPADPVSRAEVLLHRIAEAEWAEFARGRGESYDEAYGEPEGLSVEARLEAQLEADLEAELEQWEWDELDELMQLEAEEWT